MSGRAARCGQHRDDCSTNLKAAGIAPDDIDTVLITHAHPDHLWGVLDQADAELTFPNADYAIGETELNYWMQPQHPLANDADWGEVYAENMKTLPKESRTNSAR